MAASRSNISSIIHELRERIAASSSAPPKNGGGGGGGDDGALEIRFRAVLPNLLHAYVVPSPTENEREVVAILKLISQTARNIPGVFYHGKASAVLPVIGRILPFFTEPAFCARHGVIFETVGSLLSLLRAGERDAYRQFFVDAMAVVEDLLYAASICGDASTTSESIKLTLKCFSQSFTGIFDDPACLCDLPTSCKPDDGFGILMNLSGNRRWQTFATWMMKLLTKCLVDGMIFVEGLLSLSFISSACSLLCFGDADLQMACFDFARIIGSTVSYDIAPHENIIRSVLAILSEDKDGLPVFRNKVYDTCIGNCLEAFHTNCPDEVVMQTAVDLVSVFPLSVCKTRSQELKAALCNAYKRVARICPPDIWKPEILIKMMHHPEPCFQLTSCLQVAVSILGIDCVGVMEVNGNVSELSVLSGKSFNSSRVGEKRSNVNGQTNNIKRQKTSQQGEASASYVLPQQSASHLTICEREEKHAGYFHELIISFVGKLKPSAVHIGFPKPEIALTALCMVCIAFSRYPKTILSFSIFQQMLSWLPWISDQAKIGNSISLSIYLEAIHSVLLLQSPLFLKQKLFCGDKGDANYLIGVLKIPWTHSLEEHQSPCKSKISSVQVLSKLGPSFSDGINAEVLDMSLRDKAEDVVAEAIISMPVNVLWSGLGILKHIFRRLEIFGNFEHEQVKKIIPFSLGFLSCLNGSCNDKAYSDNSSCKLYINMKGEKCCSTLNLLLQGFRCSKCDRDACNNEECSANVITPPDMPDNVTCSDEGFTYLQSLFFKLLYDESSEEVQVTCVQNIRRILGHGTTEILIKARHEWVKCIEDLLLCRKKDVREAFCSQISVFAEDPILTCLFSTEYGQSKSKEQIFLDIIKHALAAAEDPQIFETLLQSTAEIMISVDINSQLFLFSLILLVDQLDNPHVTVRMNASRLIHKSCYDHVKGGLEEILLKVVYIRNELFEYLSMRLPNRPAMVREFSEAVFGIETAELLKKMVPIVLPKLVMSQQENEKALETLYELARCLNTDLVPLVVNWLPKVLAFALHQANEQELQSALQFYREHTGSDSQEIFAAALPALLDELICFLDSGDSEETERRLARIPQMVKEVARVLTGGEDLPNFLKNHFVGLLNSIDRKLLHSDDLLLQKQALKRIEMLIEMMGSHLTTYMPKLMVLIMYAIDKESLQFQGLSILHFLIKQLREVSPSSIKHVISQVFASLIPFVERDKKISPMNLNKVVEILEELVLKNRAILKQHIREFPLLPSIQALTEVNNAIQEARGEMTLKDQLRDVVVGLNHENLNVRYMVACELSKLLNTKREDVTALIIGEASADMEILSSLITSLLRGCAEESRTAVGQRLKLVCADCIGSLGAVDPAKVKGFSCQRFKIECSDDDLIFELIHKHLARAFRAAPDAIVQDSAALAIQELLKIAGCEASLDENSSTSTSQAQYDRNPLKVVASSSKDTTSSRGTNWRGQKLWDRFSNYIKEIIAPCLTSRFQLPNVGDSASAGPIYRPSMSFRRWIYYWIRKLTTHASGPRAGIFNACRGIVRHDMQTATYLLPYLVLHAVCHGSEEARHGITEEILSVLDAAASENSAISIIGTVSGQSEVCVQAVFNLLDNLGQWVDDVGQELALSQSLQSLASKQQQSRMKDQSPNALSDQEQLLIQCKNVSELLAAIPKVTLAKSSFRCQAYARALMYFESYVRDKSGSFNPAAEISGVFEDDDVSYLMEIYSYFDEPDGLSGFACLRKSLSLQDQLLINKKAGNWAEVLTSSEQALQMEPNSAQRHSDVLNCLLNMCHLQAMMTHVDGLISRIPKYKKTWSMQGVQAAWRLRRWDLMEEYLSGANEEGLLCSSSESNASFDMDVANILQVMMKKDQFSVAEKIALSKQALIAPLAAAGMDSYMRAYPHVVKLHFLRELEDFHALLLGKSFLEKSFHAGDVQFSNMMEHWENRLRFTQPSLWAREPLLSLRRLIFDASALGAQVGNCWLQYAKLCRSAGHYETANRAILEAQASGAPNVHMEKARLLWGIRRSDGAIAELQHSLLNMPVEVIGSAAISSISSLSLVPLNLPPLQTDTQSFNANRDIAKTLLLYSRWIHYTGQKQKEDVISLYTRVRELQPKWEKGYFYVAKYFEELLADARKRQEETSERGPRVLASSSVTAVSTTLGNDKSWWYYLPDVLLFYAKGLHRGHRNLFQALPRLLTLWFDFGSFYQKNGSSSDRDLKNIHGKVMNVMKGCLKDLPTYQWLTVLPQLVSRICHHNGETVRLVKHIITSVLRQYPQQALWIMAAVSKSTVPSRREAAAEIIQAARKGFTQGSNGNNIFTQFAALIDHLIRLCFHAGQSKAKTINIATEFSALKRMMPVDIIMPIQQSLTVSLPSYDPDLKGSHHSDIFSTTDLPTISGISDEAEILSSLQRPKKIVLLGSDGIERPFLCKPKDDLRKDARMMEFTATINRLLSKYPESRRRKLYIRTFAVIPLTEDCGMVQWVPHTRGLRHILQDIYIKCGKFDRHRTNPQIKRIYDQSQGKMPEDEMLKVKILPMFPPVFHKWFLTTFSEPAAWFRARTAYAHTTAVWSMVGHIVGLGDRHGENILFDSTTGDCVHVDFSCLFDKGLQLEKPELVPFRLTQNMIDGLGITGYEGIFLRVSEITLSVLRTHKDTLMSVLETFIHDPLVEWTKSHKSSGVEVQNPHAQRAISNIEARLQGVVVGVGAAPSLPLAVEGQARRLIAEAVSLKNLGKMYIWWMPWF
ncbi:serine/threonine-protein kinase ATR isoform X2 [Punica granatum]|uniref:Serine/threonine-protein kinase ATR n=2 Tax=Punica granatum TaxID=22663 RepID=A0A218X7U9_PUNGR|nr:serine/threonine-protein kinase ATR isoform X2 [Punica granatum]OWM80452.1 hypothetical protein CDL15_Pgr019732 [Punica granatum]